MLRDLKVSKRDLMRTPIMANKVRSSTRNAIMVTMKALQTRLREELQLNAIVA